MRAPRLLFSLLFLLAVQSTAAGWRQCPHHDQLAAEHGAPASAAHEDHAPDAPEHDGPCSCLDGAQCAAPVALPATAASRLVPAGPVTVLAVPAPAHQPPARIPSHYLPDATAPPVVL
jgi:hypothetical protein